MRQADQRSSNRGAARPPRSIVVSHSGITLSATAEPVTVGGALGGWSSSVAGEPTVCRGLEDCYGPVCGGYLLAGGLMVSAPVSLGEPE